ncbi:MAG: hypothetical protein ACK5WC_07890 [Aphanizomenon sp.]|jgi:hypothetical protein
MKVEYLVILKREDGQRDPFWSKPDIIKLFLESKSQMIKIHGNELVYSIPEKPEFSASLNIIPNEIEDRNETFLMVEIGHNSTLLDNDDNYPVTQEQVVENLNQVRRIIRNGLDGIAQGDKNVKVYELWNDISMFYAQKAYPLIQEIENLMRKLIMQFMLINVGVNWFEEKVPQDIQQKITKRENNKPGDNKDSLPKTARTDILQEADFIHLAELLFKPYRAIKEYQVDDILKKVKMSNSNLENTIEELSKFLPQSNWDRYFAEKINYTNLKTDWEELYKLRCSIAHNKDFTKNDFQRVIQLTTLIKSKIQEAINIVDSIEIDIEQTEEIVSSVGTILEEKELDYGYHKITKEELIEELKKYEEVVNQKPNGFIGLRYFVMEILGNKQYDFGASFDVINRLIRRGIIKKYEVTSPHTNNPVPAIRIQSDSI